MNKLLAPMGRLAFVTWTAVLLLTAFLILRVVLASIQGQYYSWPDGWHFLDPLALAFGAGAVQRYALLVHGALTIALSITGIKRARHAGWPGWTGLIMAIPIVRLFAFAALAMAPGMHHTHVLDLPRNTWIARIVPRSLFGSAVAAVLISTAIVLPLGFIDIRILEDYGLALFIGSPFLLGSVSAYLHGYHTRRPLKQSIAVAMISVSLVLLVIFVLAFEGAVCLAMAAPIVYPIALVGSLVGHFVSRDHRGGVPTITMFVVLTPSLMAFEANYRDEPPMFKVVSSLHIEASPQAVWDQLVTFSHMEEPAELIFKAGISYPIEARITGTGVGACRYCQFNTGPFVEPITHWEEPVLLAFDVEAFPPPMTELSIYEHVNAPHIHGFFQSHHGQFRLEEQPDGSTLLEGTTWYSHEIWPTWYWKLWSDGILHAIHGRVLEHIRTKAEA